MGVQIIVDSASDILASEAQEFGLIHIPMVIQFGEKEYIDGATINHKEFYEKLIESDTLPTTSQVSPAVFESVFEKVTAAGDTAVVIVLSSKLSGTYQSAVIAAEEYGDKVFVVDSENACIGERIIALRALELRSAGLSAREIAAALDEEKHHVRLLAVLDTLEYLKKGGRISAATALAGSLLAIKPVISVIDGEVALIGKARGSKNSNNLLRELIAKSGGINFDKPYSLAYSGLTDILLQKYIEDSSELLEGRTQNLPITTVGCIIGTHVGPGAIAVAFFDR